MNQENNRDKEEYLPEKVYNWCCWAAMFLLVLAVAGITYLIYRLC
jgi:hypothetical protein